MATKDLVDLLRDQVRPAFGCTEPVACALAVARAREALGEPVRKISLVTSPGVYKNGLGVGIPGTGARGIPIAAALGALIGESVRGLEVLAPVTPASVQAAMDMVSSGAVTVTYDPRFPGVYVEAVVSGDSGSAKAVIQGTHTNIVYVEKDGVPLEGSRPQPSQAGSAPEHTAAYLNGL
ncbi:MAG: serine dehydratase subunit alpha family protein, partial [Firmicutes bacterium]|nr:serine dehydratase subunit alpha family protein [Bacillota bacterium]